jgi:ribosomal protein S12 methylthiotransferase
MQTEPKKICLVSLGCPKNLVDAEMMLGFLKKDGFEFTTNPEEGDVIVVNTCGFVEDSKKNPSTGFSKWPAIKKGVASLGRHGCLTQRYSGANGEGDAGGGSLRGIG